MSRIPDSGHTQSRVGSRNAYGKPITEFDREEENWNRNQRAKGYAKEGDGRTLDGSPGVKPGVMPGHRYGMAAVFTALQGTEFPITKDDLISNTGDIVIEWYKGQPETLEEVLEDITQDDFLNMADLVHAIGDVVQSASDRKKSRAIQRSEMTNGPENKRYTSRGSSGETEEEIYQRLREKFEIAPPLRNLRQRIRPSEPEGNINDEDTYRDFLEYQQFRRSQQSSGESTTPGRSRRYTRSQADPQEIARQHKEERLLGSQEETEEETYQRLREKFE
jgi:hypothetical protein